MGATNYDPDEIIIPLSFSRRSPQKRYHTSDLREPDKLEYPPGASVSRHIGQCGRAWSGTIPYHTSPSSRRCVLVVDCT